MAEEGRIRLEIVTPEREVLREEVDEVVLPGEYGYFGVLPGHAPYLVRLRAGEARYRDGRVRRYLAVAGGFAEVQDDRVFVLADSAERPDEIDVEAARNDVSEAEEEMRNAAGDDLDVARVRYDRALIRVQVAARATR
jgi:F-type H+-transporting ATPase subunit epsilon